MKIRFLYQTNYFFEYMATALAYTPLDWTSGENGKIWCKKIFSFTKKCFIPIISICLFITPIFAQSVEQQADSIRQLIENADADTTKVQRLIDLASFYNYNHPSRTVQFAHQALALSQKIDYAYGIYDAYLYLFNGHYSLDTHSDSLLKYVQALEELATTQQDVNQTDLLIGAYWNYALYYGIINQTDKEIEAYIKALEMVRKSNPNNKENKEAELLNNIASIFEDEGKQEEALNYYHQALAKVNDEESKGNILFNITIIQKKIANNEDSVEIYLDAAYDSYKAANSYEGIIIVLRERALILDYKEEFEKANQLYIEALEMIEKHNFNYQLLSTYRLLAHHYLLRKKYNLAIKYGEKALEEVERQGNYKFLNGLYTTLDEAYTAISDFQKAHEIRGLLIAHNDSTSNITLQLKSEELQTKFQVEQTKLENELLKVQKNRAVRNRTFTIIGALVILLLLGSWTVFTYRINQQRKAQNELLAKDLKNKKTIETQKEELQILYDYKNKLFSNIAHELRTPLTLITNPIKSLLRSGNLASEQVSELQIADRNIRSLSSSIYQILDLAKRENVELIAQPIAFDVNELVQFIANDFYSMAQFKSIHFTKPPIHTAIPVITDGEKLMIVIRNLLSNAFKFTPKSGKVNIHFMDLGKEVAVSVQDTGRGIPEEDLEKIFDRHFQVNPSNLPNEGGMGIGLAICKEYMALIKGSIQAESKLLGGSTFTVRFPKKLAEAKTVHQEASLIFNALIDQNINTTQKESNISVVSASEIKDEISTILIVEDNVDMANYLHSILHEEHEIHLVQDGKQALDFLANSSNSLPDLIISDYMMPNINGLELINTLKTNNQFAAIPVIILTAQQAIDVKLDALRIGVDDYLTKPFDNRELSARVTNILNNQSNIKAEQQRQKAQDNTTDLEDTSNKMNLVDLEWLTELETTALKYIYNLDFTIYQLAAEMSMSYSAFFPKVKRLTGLTPNQYITELRFQEARKLLEIGKYGSVKAVAYSVGYKSVRYFSKNFKKRYGKYPSEILKINL